MYTGTCTVIADHAMIFGQAYAESADHATGEEEGFAQGGSHGLWQKDWRSKPRATQVALASHQISMSQDMHKCTDEIA
jgi:hypothetical protein